MTVRRKLAATVRITVLSAVLSAALSACHPSVPEGYLQPDELEELLYDIHLAKNLARDADTDRMRTSPSSYSDSTSTEREYFLAALKKHGVDEAQFDSTMVYYYGHSEDFLKIYNRVAERLKSDAARYGASTADLGMGEIMAQSGDTTDVWRQARNYIFLPAPPYNRMDFDVEADTLFHRGDTYMLCFDIDFLCLSGLRDLIVYVAVTYSNDSVATQVRHCSTRQAASIRINANDRLDVRSIRGFFYMDGGDKAEEGTRYVFVSNTRLIAFRKKEEEPKPAETGADTTKVAADTLAKGSSAPPAPADQPKDALKPKTP